MLRRYNYGAHRSIHPGEHPAKQLEELHMSAAELAHQLKVPSNRIKKIPNGRRSVAEDTRCASVISSGQARNSG